MTALAQILAARIREGGPISVADYMAECLLHPQHGYYTTRQPFGAAGDFTTAPEISQMFGELVGLAMAQSWLDQGAPTPFTLAELGPGRGTLMADVLRATKRVPGFQAAARLVLVEASPALRDRQAQTLAPFPVQWLDHAQDLPDQPLFLLANEFFDALPVRQFLRAETGWHERLIGLTKDKLVFGLSPLIAQMPDLPAFSAARPGDIVEHCAAADAVIDQITTRIQQHGGLALIFDYGGWQSCGDTLQALRAHEFDDPLAHPGQADLTAHVDFQAFARGRPHAYTTQGAFLTRLGLHTRADRLAANLQGAALESHRAAERRLTAADEMGTLFKVLALIAPGAPLPPGFDPTDAHNA